jgi:hypothetical protein
MLTVPLTVPVEYLKIETETVSTGYRTDYSYFQIHAPSTLMVTTDSTVGLAYATDAR